jgi:hypothetical protein
MRTEQVLVWIAGGSNCTVIAIVKAAQELYTVGGKLYFPHKRILVEDLDFTRISVCKEP